MKVVKKKQSVGILNIIGLQKMPSSVAQQFI